MGSCSLCSRSFPLTGLPGHLVTSLNWKGSISGSHYSIFLSPNPTVCQKGRKQLSLFSSVRLCHWQQGTRCWVKLSARIKSPCPISEHWRDLYWALTRSWSWRTRSVSLAGFQSMANLTSLLADSLALLVHLWGPNHGASQRVEQLVNSFCIVREVTYSSTTGQYWRTYCSTAARLSSNAVSSGDVANPSTLNSNQ